MNKEILKLAIPNILTNLSIPLVSMVDLALMGRMPSSNYIVAIGFGTVIFNLLYWAFGFLRMGTTGMVSQAFGRNDLTFSYQLLYKGIIVALAAGTTLIVFQNFIEAIAVYLIHPDETVITPLKTYYNWRIWAAPATISTYVIGGWLLGMQDAKAAMVLAIIVNILNATLSYIFVYHYNLSIQGVALGTLIAQYIGLLTGILILLKKFNITLLSIKEAKIFDKKDWKEFAFINSNIFIRTLCLILVLSFFKTTAANINPVLGAANILLIEFITISAYGIDGFAFAAESLCGKYFGYNNKFLFMQSIRTSFKWGIGISIFIAVLFYVFGENILSLLTNQRDVVLAALPYLPWLIIAPVINSISFIWDGVYIGTTATKAMRDTMILATVFVFIPSFVILRNIMGNHGIWLSLSLFMIARGVMQTYLAPKAIYARIK